MFECLQNLVTRGSKAKTAEPKSPEPITAAEPDVTSLSAEPAVEASAPEPVPDWAEEARTDLPPRSPQQIQWLLKFETPEQTQARIVNDRTRYMFKQSGAKSMLWNRTH